MLSTTLFLLLTLLAAALCVLAAYLLVLTAAAVVGRPRTPTAGRASRRFAILVPAHNEQTLLPRLLDSLCALEYPAHRWQVYVVADNCDDDTAACARQRGARVYERADQRLRGKGFALRWLLDQLAADGDHPDALVILDADSVVSPSFLRSMDARLGAGSEVIQAYYSVLNAGESPIAMLRFAALAALHYLRPLGRSALGLSCGLKGTGMCFSAAVLDRWPWRWFTLAEDAELHLALAHAGVRVDFAPEATVLAEMPTTLAQAQSQNARWERGRLYLLFHRVPGLLAEGVWRRSFLRLDAAVEQLIPPLSVPYALAGLCLVCALAVDARLPALLAALSLAAQTVYVVSGLVLVRAPRAAYLALCHAPLYIAWKVALYGRALVTSRTGLWVRTARVSSAPAATSSGTSRR